MNTQQPVIIFTPVRKMTDAEQREFEKNNPEAAARIQASLERWKQEYPAAFK